MNFLEQRMGFLFRNRAIRELQRFSVLPFRNRMQLIGAYFSLCFTIAMLLHIMLKPIVPPAAIVIVYAFSTSLFIIWSSCLLIPSLRKWNTILTGLAIAVYTAGQFYSSAYFSYQNDVEVIMTSRGGIIPLSELDVTVIGLCSAILVMIGIGSSMYRKVVESQTEMKLQADAELKVAESIQIGLVPEIKISAKDIHIHGKSLPASVAGGDFVDCLKLPNSQYLVVIGDVSGHGLGAAITMAMVKSAFRTLADSFTTLDQLMARLNRFVLENSSKQIFVSMSAVLLDPAARSFQYVNAGHMPALIRSASGVVSETENKSPALGINAKADYPVTRFEPEAGASILLYTDGINESVGRGDEEFGIPRIKSVFADSPDTISVARLLREVSEFSKQVRDDRSVLCIYFPKP